MVVHRFGAPVTVLGDDFLRTLARLEVVVARERTRAGDGGRGAAGRGGRTEFAGHRAYVPGDDIRRIDWSAHARTGRLHVREYERDDDTEVVLVVDASASMGTFGKFEAACRVAFALGWLALRGDARVRAGLARDGTLDAFEAVQGAAGADTLRRALGSSGPGGRTRLGASLGRIPRKARGTRVVFVVSDLLAADDARRTLAALSERGEDLVLIRVHAPGDVAAADDGECIVEDAETGERIPADAGAAERARERASRGEQDWRAFAARHRIRLVSIDAAEPLDAATVRALRAARVLA